MPVSASPAPTSPGEATPRAPSSSASTTPSTVSAPSPPTVIRLLQDRPALAMPSETVDLRKEDLLTLPQEKAQVLVHAKIAERVEVRPPTRVT